MGGAGGICRVTPAAAVESAARAVIHVVRTRGVPILSQLKLEEALLRADPDGRNWCLLNSAIPEPAVVMGISGRPEELLHVDAVKASGVPVIRRFSGGGTVVVDASTVFATLVCNRGAVPGLQLYPRPIMRWTEELYRPVFPPHAQFELNDTDYVLKGSMKFGGNAQAIVRDRWLHHTSLLWDYDTTLMRLLKNPNKAPKYRQGRDHEAFLCKLKDVISDPDDLVERLVAALSRHFAVQHVALEDVEHIAHNPHLSSTRVLSDF